MDLISRQAAIKIANKECLELRGVFDRIKNGLNALPSSHPETHWIPCSERLPEEGVSVLISVGGMYSAEGCLRWDKDWNQFRWSAIQDKEVVDAWMPLPEPYKERQEK